MLLPEPLPLETPGVVLPFDLPIVERDVILLDRRTNRILDIIENVISLATGQ